jgi:hypothetical protein
MLNPIDLKSQLTITASLAPSARTSSANGTALDLQQYIGPVLVIAQVAQATAGTTPTLDITFEDSANNSSFTAITTPITGTATQVTDAAGGGLQTFQIDRRACRRYVRPVFTIGGTSTPTFPSNAAFVGQKQVV